MRRRARHGIAAIFPMRHDESLAYGDTVHGFSGLSSADPIDALRIVPPVFTPLRMAKMVELGREPLPDDVHLETQFGGLRAPLPAYISALGSTGAAHGVLAAGLARQAGGYGLPMVMGENVSIVHGYSRRTRSQSLSFKERAMAYLEALPPHGGGLIVQQSTEDANAELWNRIYSDPDFDAAIREGRLGFELKVGQGAKPGLGGLTIVGDEERDRLAGSFAVSGRAIASNAWLRMSAPGTFTEEILTQQLRLMRNNFPRARVWVKLPPTRDVGLAARIAWDAGADAVTIDGAEGGTGWAPTAFLEHVGLFLHDALRLVAKPPSRTLLASGGVCEATRLVKLVALGASAAGLGRAALIATDEDPEQGLLRFLEALAAELKLVVSALGLYDSAAVSAADIQGRCGP